MRSILCKLDWPKIQKLRNSYRRREFRKLIGIKGLWAIFRQKKINGIHQMTRKLQFRFWFHLKIAVFLHWPLLLNSELLSWGNFDKRFTNEYVTTTMLASNMVLHILRRLSVCISCHTHCRIASSVYKSGVISAMPIFYASAY